MFNMPGRIVSAGALVALALGGVVAAVPAARAQEPAVVAAEKSPWQVRLRGVLVMPEDGGKVNGVPGSDLKYSDSVIPELDISYYFTDNIAAELILGVTKHDIKGAGSIAALGTIGSTWILPPTLTLQYHFTNFGAFKPYLGAGINYSVFFSEDAKSADSLNIDDTFGGALQVGFDYMLNDHWGLNLDVKKLLLEPDFDVGVGGQKLSGTADLNPWLVGVGVTYRF